MKPVWACHLSRVTGAADEIGGKALPLRNLVHHKLPVPPTMVLKTAAFHSFAERAALKQRLQSMPPEPLNFAALHQYCLELQQYLIKIPVPEPVVEELQKVAETFRNHRLAIRSSATAEDLPGISFAGIHETRLGVVGFEQIIEAVRACWLSLYSPRAFAYRSRFTIPHHQVAMAVLIQHMIAADVSGVAFSHTPQEGQSDTLYIESIWGLGDLLVSGKVTGDAVTIKRNSFRIVAQRTTDKKLLQGFDGSIRDTPSARRNKPSLRAREAQKLARQIMQIEEICGYPVDVEWCLQESEFFFLQARPITATDIR